MATTSNEERGRPLSSVLPSMGEFAEPAPEPRGGARRRPPPDRKTRSQRASGRALIRA